MNNVFNQRVGLPSHWPAWNDWQQKISLTGAPHQGAATGFNYMFPVSKYSEAFTSMTGPGWGGYVSYLNYNHGNQPYDYKDAGFNATRTPTTTAHIQFPLSKVSPKTSTIGTQQAQTTMAQMIAARNPGPIPFM